MQTILLIEDNNLIRENTAELLELAGYAVLAAENGIMGVEMALTAKPDLVVCDIMMPALDGYGVLQIFNQNPQLAGIPFIFLTAKTERTDIRRGMELGADDYLTKPFDKAELLLAIAGRLNRFHHLRPEYDLQADGLDKFLGDAQSVLTLASLSVDSAARHIRKKQNIYYEDDAPTHVYFVKSGRVKLTKTAENGKELIMNVYGPGDFFGYLAILENTVHRSSAVAVDDSELVFIPRDDFSLLLLRDTDVGQQFIRLLAGRVSDREQQLLEMAYSSIRRRVADILLRLHEQATTPDAYIQFSRDDMAAMIGTAPESLTRTLSEFKQDGLIELTPGNIRVLEPKKLVQIHW